jgi:predicted ATPase
LKSELGSVEWELLLSRVRMLGGELRVDYDMIMPKLYWERTSSGEFEYELLGDGKVKVEVLLNGLVPILIAAKRKDEKSLTFIPLPPDMVHVLRDLQRKLSEVHYIGPLRAPAKRYYITNVDSQPAMDAAGEFLPYVLKNRGDDTIRFPSPKQIGPLKPRKLRLVLDEWVHYLRTGDPQFDKASHEIDIPSKGDVLLEFFLRDLSGTESHALADSGFGYSQVLPILVRGLVSRVGHTLMIEQPELHLNPALQVRLADFFVGLIRSGRQVLLETHSEHIVNAVRVLAAEDESNTIAPKISIFFIDVIDGRPDVTSLNIKPDGTVPDWPASFFGEALDLSSRLLISQGRARKISRQ